MGIISVVSQNGRLGEGVSMLDEARHRIAGDGDYVEFAVAGAAARGEYHCSECGYGVTVRSTLPRCPMCAGKTWEPTDWSPLTRARLQA
jgi:rubrerythrin